jgi:hypothetical protein
MKPRSLALLPALLPPGLSGGAQAGDRFARRWDVRG